MNFEKVHKTYDYARKTTLTVFFRNYLSLRKSVSLRFFDSLRTRNSASSFLGRDGKIGGTNLLKKE